MDKFVSTIPITANDDLNSNCENFKQLDSASNLPFNPSILCEKSTQTSENPLAGRLNETYSFKCMKNCGEKLMNRKIDDSEVIANAMCVTFLCYGMAYCCSILLGSLSSL